ncbi:MAG: 23S rRNA (adenine(2503)-C(2))-methyltransferase RlmN [Candidatus Marinimicrobia bacterium]|nr:23S rRNA (adenine(2503)-C(2))-methyltransferase RlmN [Candidatus Neomarinimicrobiota bacterium]
MNSETNSKQALIGLNQTKLERICSHLKEPSFRAEQLFTWLYKSHVNSFHEMRNFPNELRQRFSEQYCIHPLELIRVTGSTAEPTRKFLFGLQTGEKIESVLMKDGDRTTLCVSSQVGCAVDCKFCATASMGFQKNLSVGEIVDQFLQVSKESPSAITNIVFMGMGEPFLNYDRVIAAADLLNNENGIKFGAQRITISTVGIVPKIIRYAEEKHRYKLAVSLNGSSQESRLKTMPIAKKYPLPELMNAINSYTLNSRHPVTFEYVLMEGITDSVADAEKLIKLLSGRRCKVNVIPYNEIGGDYRRPTKEVIETFVAVLNNAPFPVTIRWSKGTDISAGCGQLAVLEKTA